MNRVAHEIIDWVRAGPRASRPYHSHNDSDSDNDSDNDSDSDKKKKKGKQKKGSSSIHFAHSHRAEKMMEETVKELQKFYQPHNEALEELIGVDMKWNYFSDSDNQ